MASRRAAAGHHRQRPGSARPAERRWPLRAHVLVIAILFVAASAVGGAYHRHQAEAEGRRTATEDARFAARLAADAIADSVTTLRRVLAESAANPALARAFDPDFDTAGCSLSFAGIGGFPTGHIDLVRPDGAVVCSSLADAQTDSYRGAPWLPPTSSEPRLTGPVVDQRTGRQVLIASTPVAGRGALVGMVDLAALGPALAAGYGGPRKLSLLVTTADGGTALSRSIAPERWTGAPLAGTPFAADADGDERRDPDGRPRLYGVAEVPELGWRVYAGADREAALAAARRLSDRQSMITLAGLMLVMIATIALHRQVLRPIRRLSAAVRAVDPGAPPRPVPVEGPAELAALAEDFNRMAAAAERHLADVSRLAAIVQSSSDAIIGKTLDGIITSWNDGATAMYGYRPDEIIGEHMWVLVPPDRRDELADLMRRVGQGEHVQRLETRRVRKDGEVFDVSVTISPIRDANNRLVGASAVARDITAEKRAAAERESLEQRLHQSQKLESLGQLAGGVAHDFNNLLAVILSSVEFLAEEIEPGTSAANDVRAIRRAAEKGARLTRQLLIFGRKETPHPETLDLNVVIGELEDLLSRSIGEHVRLVVRPGSDLPPVRADRGQLEQVLVNLAVNARDAMPDGGRLTIETAAVEVDESYSQLHPQIAPGHYVQLSVSDTGSGMTPDVVARAFEPFFTTKPKGAGTGLGLATVYGIVTEAGGNVSIYSEPGLGTTFRVYLPQAERGAEEQATPPVPVAPPRGDGETVLVVEDEPELREVTCRMLRRNGYEVVPAADGAEALELAEQTRWDLLLTDVVMPGMSGRELADRLRARRPDLTVLFMSGYSQGVLGPRQAVDADVTLIEKPFSEATLVGAVHAALAERGDRAEGTARPAATAG